MHPKAQSALILSIVIVLAGIIFLMLFSPGLKYKIDSVAQIPPDSKEFMISLEALTDSKANPHTEVEVLANGERFYPAMLDAIRHAQHNVDWEAYIWEKGKVADEFLQALTERARAGVRVNLNLDGLGSGMTLKHNFKELIDAGGKVYFYHPMRWYNVNRYNNRTHRELLVVDGKVGFVGGAGVADHWLYAKDAKNPRWRDSMFRVQGDAVTSLQGTFVENWLQSSGEVLNGAQYFPDDVSNGKVTALVVNSTPSVGGSTRARFLFQTLLASARKSIHITTPYFMPDKSARGEMIRAVQRGVEVTVITAGTHNDHWLSRTSSRRLYGDLLKNGVKIYEYAPSMIHVKAMLIDGQWSVVGSTNFDNRSFGLNDEVNLAGYDGGFAERLEQDFQADVGNSRNITLQEWEHRPWHEKLREFFGWLLERQT